MGGVFHPPSLRKQVRHKCLTPAKAARIAHRAIAQPRRRIAHRAIAEAKSPYGAASDIGRKKARMEHQRHRAKKRPYGAASDIGRPKRNCTNARLLSILFAYWRLSCTLIYAKDVPFVVSFHGDARRACIDGADGKRGGSKEVVKCLKRCSSKSG